MSDGTRGCAAVAVVLLTVMALSLSAQAPPQGRGAAPGQARRGGAAARAGRWRHGGRTQRLAGGGRRSRGSRPTVYAASASTATARRRAAPTRART